MWLSRCTNRAWWCLLAFLVSAPPAMAADAVWQAGLARVVITPAESMWMAGYAARNRPSEGVAQDLYAKALVLRDSDERPLIILTADLIGIPRQLRDRLVDEIESRYEVPPARVLLNASHTHCGPELRADKVELMGLEPGRAAQSHAYLETLYGKFLEVIQQAMDDVRPARLSYTHGRAGFAMNRRLPTPGGIQNSVYPDGPVDHDVPVLRVDDPEGALRGVVFGYACHNTTLSFYQFCGDYAGYAQQYLEEAHPGCVAMFVTGCGGDQNPQPRRTLELAQQHGRALANGVEAALLAPPRSLAGPLEATLVETELAFAEVPTRDELQKWRSSNDVFTQRRATVLLEQLDQQGAVRSTYPYLVQAVRFGDGLLLVALAGEVVVDYSLRLKLQLGGRQPVWVAGYSNDVFGYVPSLRVLSEGGYEGGGAMRYTTLPGPFAEDVEQRILEAVDRAVQHGR